MQSLRLFALAGWFLLLVSLAFAQEQVTAPPTDPAQRIRALEERLTTMEQTLAKDIDDLMWFQRMGDIAVVDKVKYTGPPPRVVPNPTGQGATNPVIINAYTFFPKKFPNVKLPLLVYVHGGVHSDFNTSSLHIIRELIEQGYAVIAADYRGSTGYGRGFWQLIDYGGLENEDVYAGMKWMLENHTNLDPQRVGILGWSHGGMITLMNIFEHPQDYKVAYAGVPVSDLIARMGYKGQGYRDLYSAPYHLGKTERKLPGGYSQVVVPVFTNKTMEPGIEVPFTNALIYEFERARSAKPVESALAEAEVQGRTALKSESSGGTGKRLRIH